MDFLNLGVYMAPMPKHNIAGEETPMSKYNALWEYVQRQGSQSFNLSFDEIQDITGIPIDHSFLNYKKELMEYGYQVGKISMKDQTVRFEKMGEGK